ncbi:hypothetical protein GCM10010505_76040 [Kitasatospora aburaviensis]
MLCGAASAAGAAAMTEADARAATADIARPRRSFMERDLIGSAGPSGGPGTGVRTGTKQGLAPVRNGEQKQDAIANLGTAWERGGMSILSRWCQTRALRDTPGPERGRAGMWHRSGGARWSVRRRPDRRA